MWLIGLLALLTLGYAGLILHFKKGWDALPGFTSGPRTTPLPFVTVLIPARNEEKNIGRCIDSVKNVADEIIVLDIYPARELPMEGITSSWLLSKIKNTEKKLISKTELISAILESKAKIIVTIGAGDIGELVPKIKQALI